MRGGLGSFWKGGRVREAGGGFFLFEIFCIELLGITGISRGGGGCGPFAAQAVKEGFVFRKKGFCFPVPGGRSGLQVTGGAQDG